MKRIIILGAGISGLSLGWFLKRRFGTRIKLQIFEKSCRAGGWIRTVREKGFLFELGPRSLRSRGSGIETLKLLEQLGMEKEIIEADFASRYRYLLINKKLRALPSGPLSLLSSPLMWGVLSACIRDLLAPPSVSQDESIYAFIARRFGKGIAVQLIDALTTGIYAGDIRELSIRSCFPWLHQLEQQSGSLLKGMIKARAKKKHPSSHFIESAQKAALFSLRGGLEDLAAALSGRLEEHIVYSSRVKSIHSAKTKGFVELESGDGAEADYIFSTIPAEALAPLVSDHRELSALLQGIPAVSVASVSFGFHRKVLKKKGFGYLVPSKEKEDVLGVVFDSSVFPCQNQMPEETRLTVMIGGARLNDFEKQGKGDFLAMARRALEKQLGISADPDASVVNISPRCIPQYLVGHSERVSRIENILSSDYPRIRVHGSSFHGVSVNDCIAGAKRLEESLKIM